MKYSKHNIQQNKETKKKSLSTLFTEKSLNLLSKLVTRFCHKSLANSFWESSKPIIVAILHWAIAVNAASFRSANYIKHGLISE